MLTYIDVMVNQEHCYNCETLIAARKNENKASALRFHLTDEMLDKWIYVEILKANKTTKVISSKLEIDTSNKTAEFIFTNQITDIAGEIIVDVVLKDSDGLDWKTFRKKYLIEDSISASNEIQEEAVDFITEAQKILEEIKETGGTGGNVDDVLVDNVSVVKNKIANIKLREAVIGILVEYGLIQVGGLTEEQIQALNEMECIIDENGELNVIYNGIVLDIKLQIEDGNLIIDNNINATFNINNNGELEVSYE